jgi:hypothetical protein
VLGRRNRDKRNRPERRPPTAFDRARDELFSAIRQCGVIEAPEEEQSAWMEETLQFMAERHPELTPVELRDLKDTGLRFCRPVIPHGKEHTALTREGANAA